MFLRQPTIKMKLKNKHRKLNTTAIKIQQMKRARGWGWDGVPLAILNCGEQKLLESRMGREPVLLEILRIIVPFIGQ